MATTIPASALADAVLALRKAGCVFAEDEAEMLGAAAADEATLSALVRRRAAGEPLEQVVGYADFCGFRIRLRPGVFVPRVRSELLVRLAVKQADRASQDQASQGQAGQGQAGQGQAGQDQAGQDQAGQYQAGQYQAGQGRAGQNRAGQGRAGQDQAGQYQAGQDQAGQDQAGQDQAGQDQAGQDQAGQDQAGQDQAGQDRAGQDQAGQDRRRQEQTGGEVVVVDLCCGSGALGLVVAARTPHASLYAADIDPNAVACARDNLGGDTEKGADDRGRRRVFQGDLFDALPAELAGTIDVLLANVPYVATRHIPLLPAEARDHEPHTALDGGADGLDVFRAVVAQAPRWLAPEGILLTEVTEAQIDAATAAVLAAGLLPEVTFDDDLEATVVTGRRRAISPVDAPR